MYICVFMCIYMYVTLTILSSKNHVQVELLIFNILTYSVFDMWSENTCVAILCCYLFDYALVYVRHTFGTAMVSSKTLIDDRFLM